MLITSQISFKKNKIKKLNRHQSSFPFSILISSQHHPTLPSATSKLPSPSFSESHMPSPSHAIRLIHGAHWLTLLAPSWAILLQSLLMVLCSCLNYLLVPPSAIKSGLQNATDQVYRSALQFLEAKSLPGGRQETENQEHGTAFLESRQHTPGLGAASTPSPWPPAALQQPPGKLATGKGCAEQLPQTLQLSRS